MSSHSLVRPRPRKRLGQHFLIDPNIVRKIMAVAAVRFDETVLEIGPGQGILTRALCAASRSVLAIELDARLVTELRATLAGCSNLDLRQGDALAFPYDTLPAGTVVVANLPYNISTPILFRLLAASRRIDRMVLMLQSEVARRLVAKPGRGDYGVLSVLVQYRTRPSLAFQVSARCFRPIPEVDSAVVTLVTRDSRLLPEDDEPVFTRTVRAAFAHRRKTLLNSLRDEGLPAAHATAALRKSGIEPSRRAETLTLEEFGSLAQALKPHLHPLPAHPLPAPLAPYRVKC